MYSTVSGGEWNEATVKGAAIFGGKKNAVSGELSSIIGGFNNKVTSKYSVVLGGKSSTVQGSGSLAFGPDVTINSAAERSAIFNLGTGKVSAEKPSEFRVVAKEFSLVMGNQDVVTIDRTNVRYLKELLDGELMQSVRAFIEAQAAKTADNEIFVRRSRRLNTKKNSDEGDAAVFTAHDAKMEGCQESIEELRKQISKQNQKIEQQEQAIEEMRAMMQSLVLQQ